MALIFSDIVRQDNPDFINALNKIRVGDTSGIEYFNKNVTAEKINREKLSQIKEPVHIFISESEGKISDSEKPVSDKIKLKIGTQVVVTANGENYSNDLLYVSLSRCRKVDSMYLSSYLSRNMVKTSPYVNDFYEGLEKN